ncbi:MAG: DUF4011 domain-containing protein [Clostridia bacterium]|nr:DUF4011 domain-containing protein [Clostridia bacterium]
MGKGIYTFYKNRLVEIGGNNKCLYLKNVVRKGAYDIGKLFSGREDKIEELVDFLWGNKKKPLTLLSEKEIKDIYEAVSEKSEQTEAEAEEEYGDDKEKPKRKGRPTSERNRLLEAEVAKVKEIKREIEEIYKETGRYELYVGYPFVFGSVMQGSQRTLIKAPLLLFPVRIDIVDERTVELRLNEAEKVQVNRALIFAYAQSRKMNIDNLELEFDDMSSFKNVKQVVDYLNKEKVRIENTTSKNVFAYSRFKEPESDSELSIRYAALLARFPLSNSIYNDYTLLERKNLTNDAINELLRTDKSKKNKLARLVEKAKSHLHARKFKRKKKFTAKHSYTVKMLDYAQSEVVKKVDEMGNMVIYGPPGTGKSQTIVNIITDAMVKNKKVLVVSQKKAALDVVYSRLGTLNEKAMYINDESKEKKAFYERCYAAHQKDEVGFLSDVEGLKAEFTETENKIASNIASLEDIYHLLNDKRPFGLSLTEMYASSYMFQKNSVEHQLYSELVNYDEVMSLSYKEISDALFAIKAKDLSEMYYTFAQAKDKNPMIDMMLPDVDLHTLTEVKLELEAAAKSKKGYFNISKYPYTRQVLAHYSLMDNEKMLKRIVRLENRLEHPLQLFPAYSERVLKEKFEDTIKAIDKFTKEYECLNKVMTRDGYISVIDNLLRGNTPYLKLVFEAIDNYISLRDVTTLFRTLDKNTVNILDFAYTATKTKQGYYDAIDKVMLLRIYHEILTAEDENRDRLSKILDFPNIASRIYKLKESELALSQKLCAGKNSTAYRTLFENAENSKDYLYQISKEQKFWPIRKMMEVYGDFILNLFPCWLLSPENVSSLLPLRKNMFDVVIFDEASQVFIESTIPTIYRGKNIVVAGDSKQLRPSATFMKRYLGADPETLEDYSIQAALEVESLLDLAVSRYDSANLTYHYRSRNQELIDFSNSAFYSSNLQIAPNISANKKSRPIERYKVDGRWIGRTNTAEAEKIVEILKNIFKTRKHNESIGIITFNSDQQACIADAIDRESRDNESFRAYMAKENFRLDGGEDTSLFIKNLENVQGDERDIIIFSIGYAPNETGRVYTNFGSLSTEGGENRLNVAITRAKSKIIVVTSIEPEELKVDTAKNLGPRLLRDYLAYARAVSEGDTVSVNAILTGLDPKEKAKDSYLTSMPKVEEQIKERLEKMGYTVHTGLGNRNNRISLAVYDEETDKYLVGVELDTDAFATGATSLERDVYKPKFLEARGWTVIRVWCRDWWLSPQKVVKNIASIAEKNRA